MRSPNASQTAFAAVRVEQPRRRADQAEAKTGSVRAINQVQTAKEVAGREVT